MSATFRPRLRRGVHIAPADQGRWQVRWDFDEVAFLEGEACFRILSWLAPQLDGSRTVAELEQQASHYGQQADLYAVLECLIEEGFLSGASHHDQPATNLRLALELLLDETGPALERLEQTQVLVCGSSPLAERVAESARAQGMSKTDVLRDWDSVFGMISSKNTAANVLPVVIETDWTPDVLDAVNEWALAFGKSWMLLGAWNQRILVGPLFVPPETACYGCYRKRLDSHRTHLAAYQEFENWRRSQTEPVAAEPVLPGIAELAAAWTALELFAQISATRPSRIVGRVLVYHPLNSQIDFETVLRIPWCIRCRFGNSEVSIK